MWIDCGEPRPYIGKGQGRGSDGLTVRIFNMILASRRIRSTLLVLRSVKSMNTDALSVYALVSPICVGHNVGGTKTAKGR